MPVLFVVFTDDHYKIVSGLCKCWLVLLYGPMQKKLHKMARGRNISSKRFWYLHIQGGVYRFSKLTKFGIGNQFRHKHNTFSETFSISAKHSIVPQKNTGIIPALLIKFSVQFCHKHNKFSEN